MGRVGGEEKKKKKRRPGGAKSAAPGNAKKKELVDARNMAETLVYSAEKALKEAGDKISAEERKNIEDKIAALKDAQKSEDVGTIKKATENLSAAAQKIGEALYKQQAASDKKQEDEKKPEETKTEEKKTEDK